MPKAAEKSLIFPPSFEEEREALRVFLKYFPKGISDKANGRFAPKYYGILFHPDFGPASRRSTVWVGRFWPESTRQQARRAARIPSDGPAFRSWHTKALKRRVERVLGNLLIPTTVPGGADWVMYRSRQDGYLPGDPAPLSDERRTALDDPTNYTFFRRPRHNERTLNRLLVPPPDLDTFQEHEPGLPPEICCLYRAWRTIYRRAIHPIDPLETGLEWTDSGYIFVNWRRFLKSPYAPAAQITPEEVAATLRGGRKGGQYRLKLSAFPEPENFRNLNMATRVVDLTSLGEYEDPCSLIDPLYLSERTNLFTSPFHKARTERARRTQARSQERRVQNELDTAQGLVDPDGRTVKVYPFPYTPYEHVPRVFADFEKPLSFHAKQNEVAYAIQYRKELFFRPPTIAPITKDSPQCEKDAWQKAMATFRINEHFTKTGEIGAVKARPYEEVAKELCDAELELTAAKEIENFLSLDELSNAELKRMRRLTAKRYGEDPEHAAEGERWYYDKVRALARRTLPVSAVCRSARVIIPEIRDEQTGRPVPTMAKFFSRQALKRVQQVAGDAPYLYAWATYCLKAHAVGITFAAQPQDNTKQGHWTPQEDLILLQQYRAYPRMKKPEKAALLTELPRYNWDGIVRRARQLNSMLADVLMPSQMHRFTVGKLWFPETQSDVERLHAIKQLLVVIGIASYRRYLGEPLRRGLTSVAKALTLEPKVLSNLVLPHTYRSDHFERVTKGATLS